MPLKAEGEFALVKESIEKALDKSGQPVKRGTMAHDHELYMTLADTAGQLRDTAALQQFAPRLEQLALRDNHRLYLAIAHRAKGIAHRLKGEFHESGARLIESLEVFRELGTPWQVGRTLVELAELELAQQHSESARQYFARSLSEFDALGAAPEVARIRAALAEVT